MKKVVVKQIKRCTECPNYDHSGAFTPGGAIPLCRGIGGKGETIDTGRYRYPMEHCSVLPNKHRGYTGEIPDWCPLPHGAPIEVVSGQDLLDLMELVDETCAAWARAGASNSGLCLDPAAGGRTSQAQQLTEGLKNAITAQYHRLQSLEARVEQLADPHC